MRTQLGTEDIDQLDKNEAVNKSDRFQYNLPDEYKDIDADNKSIDKRFKTIIKAIKTKNEQFIKKAVAGHNNTVNHYSDSNDKIFQVTFPVGSEQDYFYPVGCLYNKYFAPNEYSLVDIDSEYENFLQILRCRHNLDIIIEGKNNELSNELKKLYGSVKELLSPKTKTYYENQQKLIQSELKEYQEYRFKKILSYLPEKYKSTFSEYKTSDISAVLRTVDKVYRDILLECNNNIKKIINSINSKLKKFNVINDGQMELPLEYILVDEVHKAIDKIKRNMSDQIAKLQIVALLIHGTKIEQKFNKNICELLAKFFSFEAKCLNKLNDMLRKHRKDNIRFTGTTESSWEQRYKKLDTDSSMHQVTWIIWETEKPSSELIKEHELGKPRLLVDEFNRELPGRYRQDDMKRRFNGSGIYERLIAIVKKIEGETEKKIKDFTNKNQDKLKNILKKYENSRNGAKGEIFPSVLTMPFHIRKFFKYTEGLGTKEEEISGILKNLVEQDLERESLRFSKMMGRKLIGDLNELYRRVEALLSDEEKKDFQEILALIERKEKECEEQRWQKILSSIPPKYQDNFKGIRYETVFGTVLKKLIEEICNKQISKYRKEAANNLISLQKSLRGEQKCSGVMLELLQQKFDASVTKDIEVLRYNILQEIESLIPPAIQALGVEMFNEIMREEVDNEIYELGRIVSRHIKNAIQPYIEANEARAEPSRTNGYGEETGSNLNLIHYESFKKTKTVQETSSPPTIIEYQTVFV